MIGTDVILRRAIPVLLLAGALSFGLAASAAHGPKKKAAPAKEPEAKEPEAKGKKKADLKKKAKADAKGKAKADAKGKGKADAKGKGKADAKGKAKEDAKGKADASDDDPGSLRLSGVTFEGDDLFFTLEDSGKSIQPDRITVRRLDLAASLLAGFDPLASAPTAARLRFSGAPEVRSAKRGETLPCDSKVRRRCVLEGFAPEDPGAYWITAHADGREAYHLVLEEAGQVLVRGDLNRVAVWAIDDAGTPLDGATVVAIYRRKVVGRGKLAADGVILLDLKGAAGGRPVPGGRSSRGRKGPAAGATSASWSGEEPIWVHLLAKDRSPRDALVAMVPSKRPVLEPTMTLTLDRHAYRPGDSVRLFAAFHGVPTRVSEVRFAFAEAPAEAGGDSADADALSHLSKDAVSARLTSAGTAVATLDVPLLPPGPARLLVDLGDAVLSTEIPIAPEDARVVRPADLGDSATGPVRIVVDETLRHRGSRWTRGLESDGGMALVRAVPLPTYDRDSAATGELVDPGLLAGMPVTRRVPLAFHGDIRYEIPYASLTAAGGPAVTYVRVVERSAVSADAKKARGRDGTPGAVSFDAADPLWELAAFVEGKLSAPPMSVEEPSSKTPITVGSTYVRAGERLPVRGKPGGGRGGLVLLEDSGPGGGIHAVVPFDERTPALSLPETVTAPRVVARVVGSADDPFFFDAPILPGRRFLGIDLEHSGDTLTVYLYDDGGKPVHGRAVVVVHPESALPPLRGWTPPAVTLFGGAHSGVADGERMASHHYPDTDIFDLIKAIGDVFDSTRVEPPARTDRVASPLLWKANLDVDGSASIAWSPPAEAADLLLRVDVLAVGAGRAGRRVFFVP